MKVYHSVGSKFYWVCCETWFCFGSKENSDFFLYLGLGRPLECLPTRQDGVLNRDKV